MYLVHNRSDFLSKFLTLFFHHLCFSENGKSLHVLNLEGCRGLVLDRHQFNQNLGTFMNDVPRFLAIFDLPTYLVLLYNVPFLGLSWTHLPNLIWDVINERSLPLS